MKLHTLLSEAFDIYKRFGIKHTIERTLDFIKAKQEHNRITNKYKQTKPDGVVQKKIHGHTMELSMDDFGIHKELFIYGTREPAATALVQKLLNKNDIVLEAGANIGYYALIEAPLCQHVLAVEPDVQNFSALQKNISRNNISNISCFNQALGDTNGEQLFYTSEKSNWHSFYKTDAATTSVIVPMQTVDAFCSDKPQPTVARMDVEGYELGIIQGMKKTLAAIRWLFIEVHSDIMTEAETKTFFDILHQNNFVVHAIYKYDMPGLTKELPTDYWKKIYAGDKGNYEMFFYKK